MKSNLFKLWKQRELEIGKTIEPYEIAKATGMHPRTVEQILNGRVGRMDLPKVDIICKELGITEEAAIFIYEPEAN